MKRFFIITAIALFTFASVKADPRAVGGRIGNGAWASYQHYTNNEHILQIDLGFSGFSKHGQGVETVFTFNWESEIGTNWYVIYGFGIGGGYEFNHLWRKKLWVDNFDENGEKTSSTRVWSDDSGKSTLIKEQHLKDYQRTGYGFAGYAGIALNLCFEYQLSSAPVAIGIDWRPIIGVDFGRLGNPSEKPVNNEENNYDFQARYHMRGLLDFGLSVRYVF